MKFEFVYRRRLTALHHIIPYAKTTYSVPALIFINTPET